MGDFDGYETIEARMTSHAAEGFTVDINGTQLLFKQGAIPVLLEIYVEDETEPIGAINIAKGETATLGGVNEGLADDIESVLGLASETIVELESLRQRVNPAGTSSSYLPDNITCPACGEEYYEKERLIVDRMDEAWEEADSSRDPCFVSPKGEENAWAYYHEDSNDG